MKIFVIGTRGIPDIQGGVEQHCECLYPLLASKDTFITVFRRKPYIVNRWKKYSNIDFIDLWSTRIPGFEAFYHTFLSAIICIFRRPDIVHVHNIGPGFFIPLLKIAGLKVVMTYHSPNYEHVKWSGITANFLKFSEFLSIRFSDKVIFVSAYQKDKLGNKDKFVHINNGVKSCAFTNNDNYIRDLGLIKKRYILAVGRIVEEKGFDLLIKAFAGIRHKGYQLVIAGGADHETAYSIRLKELAKVHDVIMTGFVRDEKLQQLYSHAGLFVLPSFNEGLPISLLEAMSYSLPVLASNIQANLQVSLPVDSYFKSGDQESLLEMLDKCLDNNPGSVKYDMTTYNWDQVVLQTRNVFVQVLNKQNADSYQA